MNKIRIKRLLPEAKLPVYASSSAAAADLCSAEKETVTVMPGKTVLIHTGLSAEIPEGYAGFIYARSGLASKRGLAPANKVGVIDSDYRGEIMVPIHNHSDSVQEIASGERVAQMVIMPYVKAEFVESEQLNDTDRATKGFGSTGTK